MSTSDSPAVPPSPGQLDALLQNASARVHFVGVGGSGMSALAQFRALDRRAVSGSDRGFDQGEADDERARSAALGVGLFPQDGSGVVGAALVVVSTAVESTIDDVRVARASGVPIAHRSQWLAAHVRARRTIAVTGTSGKSTVVAMIFEALRGAGLDPGVITGGDLRLLQEGPVRGNAWPGSGPLVIEADESDKSVLHYTPEVGVILNLQRDHDEVDAMVPALTQFRRQIRGVCVLGGDAELDRWRDGAITYGTHASANHRVTEVGLTRAGSTFAFGGVPVTLPVPGRHNVDNAAAALAACVAIGADLRGVAAALSAFRGVARRFETVATPRGIEIIDDFAHNPAKIAAALATATSRSARVFALFQPHGFQPTRFLRHDLVRAFAAGQRPDDQLYLPEILYRGGTVVRDISSRDLCADLVALGKHGVFLADRNAFAATIRPFVRAGDCVLVMGARDPSLPAFVADLARALA